MTGWLSAGGKHVQRGAHTVSQRQAVHVDKIRVVDSPGGSVDLGRSNPCRRVDDLYRKPGVRIEGDLLKERSGLCPHHVVRAVVLIVEDPLKLQSGLVPGIALSLCRRCSGMEIDPRIVRDEFSYSCVPIRPASDRDGEQAVAQPHQTTLLCMCDCPSGDSATAKLTRGHDIVCGS